MAAILRASSLLSSFAADRRSSSAGFDRYGTLLNSLSPTTRSCGSLALFTRYSNSPLCFGNFLVTMYAPPGTRREGGRKKHSLTDLELIKQHDTPSPNHNIIYEIPGYPGYALRLLTRRASAGGIGAEALGVWDRRKARRRCMFSITAARRSASCFIANAISASRRSIRDAMLSFGSLSIGSGCFASSIIGRPCTRYHV